MILRYQWDQTSTLNVNVSSLKRLTLISRPKRDKYQERVCRHKIVVNAPNLEFIELTDQWPHDIFLKDLPNIVEAHIDIATFGRVLDKMCVLLQLIVNVRRLFLCRATFFGLSNEVKLALPIFCNLVFLELDYSNGPVGLMDLLHSSPNLEVLSFPSGLYHPRLTVNAMDFVDGDVDIEFRMNDPQRVPECLRHSLKVVQINNFSGEEVELNIMRYLFKNAMMLERMTFSFYPGVQIDELQTILSNHPRLSTDCQLEFLL